MKTLDDQPEYLREKCICRSITKVYNDSNITEKEQIDSISYSGYNEAEAEHIYKEYDGNGILKYIRKDHDNFWQVIEFNESGEEIENDKYENYYDSNKNIIREVHTDINGDVSEQIYTYDNINKVSEITFFENGVQTDRVNLPFNNTDEPSTVTEISGDKCSTVYENRGSKRVHTTYRYTEELAKSLFIKEDGYFFITSVSDCAEAELLTLLDKTPQEIKIFIEEEYDQDNNLLKKDEIVGTSVLFSYERRTYYPETEEIKLSRKEMDKSTGNTLRQFELEFSKGELIMDKITYWEYSIL